MSAGQLRCGWTLLTVAAAGLAAFPSGAVRAQCDLKENQELLNSDGDSLDTFGRSVAISGKVAIIGAAWDGENGTFAGSAYIFRHDGVDWVEEVKLLPSDGAAYHQFGWSVDISGTTAVIGAPVDNLQSSDLPRAYVFRRTGLGAWVEDAILMASDAQTFTKFGQAVANSGSVAIVGAPEDSNENGAAAGAVYHFRASGGVWSEFEKVIASDGQQFDFYGESVALAGRRVVVGSTQRNPIDPGRGAAYVYVNHTTAGLVEEAILTASDGEDDDEFGGAVAIQDGLSFSNIASSISYILVGAVEDAPNGPGSGSAYVFSKRPGFPWTQQRKLVPFDGADGDQFGWSVAITPDAAMVGAIHDDDNGSNSGSAYIFIHSNTAHNPWSVQTKLLPTDGQGNDLFGISASIGGIRGIVGAVGHGDNGFLSGAAYAVNGLANCNINSSLDACDIQEGTSQDVNGNGIPDECEP